MAAEASHAPAYAELAGVEKIYASPRGPVHALQDIDLAVGEREFLSVLGPSGCGKSTLLKCVAGLERVSGGAVTVKGEPVTAPPDDMGVVFQRDILLDWRTILDNVLITAEFRRLDRRAYMDRARDLLALYGLSGFEDRHPWELSGGMRQRAAICRALLTDPELLLMDEPFGALDAMTRDDLNVELQRIWTESRKTVLFITHSITEAVYLSDRVVVMARNPGRIAEVIDIDLPRPRSLALRETAPFAAYTSHIRETFTRLGGLHE